MNHNYWARALELRNLNYWAHGPQLLKPPIHRAPAPQQEQPPQWEARTPQLERSPQSKQQQGPNTAKNK